MRSTDPDRTLPVSRSFLLTAAFLVSAAVAPATPGFSVWDGGSGDWDRTYANWDGGHRWSNNSNALLGGTSGTLTLQEHINVKILEFASAGYAVAGAYQLDVKDGILVDAGVTSASISAAMILSKAQSWDVATAGALLTVGSIDMDGKDLAVTGAGDVTVTSGFTGLGSLAMKGTGTLWLAGSASHTGPTSVTAGTLKVTGTATSSPLTVSGEGLLTGTGTVGTLTIGSGGTLSPGLGVGMLAAGNTAWQAGGYYNWQIADATGAAGTGFDQLVSTGTLSVESTTLSRFKINLWSLAGLVDGTPANFNPGSAYAWDIATFGSVTGFDPSRFLIVRGPSEGTGGFSPATGGSFSLTSDGTHITLHYTPNGEPVWIDATGSWSDGTRWLGGATPANGSAIVFAGTGGYSTNDALTAVNSIRFSADAAGAYAVLGDALTLGSGGITNESAFLQEVAVDLTLVANSFVVTHSATILLSGGIDTAGHTLVVDGDHDTEISGVVSGTGAILKTDFGRLTLSGANTYTGGTQVLGGELIVNGGVLGATVVNQAGLLGGHGTLTGAVSVAGVLSPGASPGVLTQAAGDLTLVTGARFIAELGGVTPGAGDGYHDQYDILAGRAVIQVDVALDARGWDDALGAGYLTKRGDVFTVLRTSGGIVDTFADLTNADRAERILFDNNTDHAHLYGNLYGTGLTGTQTLGAYAVTANQAAFAAALERAAVTASASSTADHPAGFIDSAHAEGRVVLAVLKGGSLDPYSPEPYLGVTDHALTSLRAVVDGFLGRQTRSLPGAWSFSFAQGYLNNTRTGGSTPAFDREHSAANSALGATCDAGPSTTFGFFLARHDGKFMTRHGRADFSGSLHGVTLVQRLADTRPAVLKACIAWADLDFTSVRDMNLGASGDSEIVLSGATSTARNIPVTALSVQATADLQLAQGHGYELTGVVGFVRGRSTLGAFTEAGTGANLTVAVEPEETSRGILGLSYAFVPSLDTAFTLTAAWEREMGDPATRLAASLAGEGFTVEDAFTSRDTGLLGLTFAQQYAGQVSLQLTAEVRLNRDTSNDRRYNLSVSKRF